jgi:hypothetical protein
MSFWNKARTNRADRSVGAEGQAPDPKKLYEQKIKANEEPGVSAKTSSVEPCSPLPGLPSSDSKRKASLVP